jgi:nitroimidazol reductase NimA-like FMN-containing flavoprotein (pyridoxamine 5'-phosphate oxidase superfamily)
VTAPFDVDGFLRDLLIARIATNGPDGPSIRPVLYLWEDGAFWWVTSSYAHTFLGLIAADPRVALVIDAYDPKTGLVRKVTAVGLAEVLPLDRDRAVRCTSRVLGDDPDAWDPESHFLVFEDPGARLVRVRPTRLVARDLSYEPPGGQPDDPGDAAPRCQRQPMTGSNRPLGSTS